MNKTNKILILSVSALCIVGSIALLRAVFSSADFGSVSDWISSLSTLGTLVVALIALKKAPDWLGQKKHEDAYILSKIFFLEQLPSLSNAISRIGSSVNKLALNIEFGMDSIDKVLTKEDSDINMNLLNDAHNIIDQMNFKINQLEMLGWQLKQDSRNIIDEMYARFNAIDNEWSYMWFRIDNDVITSVEEKKKEIFKESIAKTLNSIDLFNTKYTHLKRLNNSFDVHFNKPTLKK